MLPSEFHGKSLFDGASLPATESAIHEPLPAKAVEPDLQRLEAQTAAPAVTVGEYS